MDQLKTQAFAAIRTGDFNAGNDLLGRALKASTDPSLVQMHTWTSQFEQQLKGFADERHTAYEKAVADVKKLLDSGHEDYALDFADRTRLDDDKAFHDLGLGCRSLLLTDIKHASRRRSRR